MTPCVLDTSTALAWYLPESFSDSAREWQAEMLGATMTFIVPSLHFREFGNVLRTLCAQAGNRQGGAGQDRNQWTITDDDNGRRGRTEPAVNKQKGLCGKSIQNFSPRSEKF